ncbi:MAG: GyrI-like domain-containing protein [Oscillospiraceae bacterium]|nr:GyrI-like domain-containing protein [Oscillospiraceae bacterium]
MTVNTMNYQAVIREIGEWIIYSEERSLEQYSDVSMLVLAPATECRRLNPDIECVKPDYGFCEYLDGEHKETNMRVRYSHAVTKMSVGNERICFRVLPATEAICIYHKGAYGRLGEAYAYIHRYAMERMVTRQQVSTGSATSTASGTRKTWKTG